MAPNGGALWLGMHPDGFNCFEGRIDELAFYDHPLSATRIAAHIAAAH